jgi:hypothetical protein
VKLETGEIQLGGKEVSRIITSTEFGDFRLRFEFQMDQNEQLDLIWGTTRPYVKSSVAPPGWMAVEYTVVKRDKSTLVSTAVLDRQSTKLEQRLPFGPDAVTDLAFAVSAGKQAKLRNIKLKPLTLAPVFNGKDLAGWKRFTADEKRANSQFTVTPEGWLNVKNGPGDLQTEKQFADFVFQGECISNGKHLNSGIFFRCLPGQYQQGYEMQIRNQWEGDDRNKPVDFGTGAIYRRQPARKVVSTDGEWFAMTLIAHGRHMATWINGYPVVNWTDPRPESENARNGAKLGAGPLSIQGHDPTTDLSFRNLRAAGLKEN